MSDFEDESFVVISRESVDKSFPDLDSGRGTSQDTEYNKIYERSLQIVSLANAARLVEKETQNLKDARKINEILKKIIDQVNAMKREQARRRTEEEQDHSGNLVAPTATSRFSASRQPFGNSHASAVSNNSQNLDVENSQGYFILKTCLASFFSAFVLFACVSTLSHWQTKQLLKHESDILMEKISNFERSRQSHENSRETMLHLKYDEARECWNHLNSCQSREKQLDLQLHKLQWETEGKDLEVNKLGEQLHDAKAQLKEKNDLLMENNLLKRELFSLKRQIAKAEANLEREEERIENLLKSIKEQMGRAKGNDKSWWSIFSAVNLIDLFGIASSFKKKF